MEAAAVNAAMKINNMDNNAFYPFAFFEGKIIPAEMAKVSIMTNALQYGTAVFGGIRAYLSADKKNLNVFRIEDHYRRFLDSLKIINKTIPYTHKELTNITLELVQKNKPKTDTYIRPFAYGRNYEISPDLSNLDFDFAIYMISLGEYLPINKGLKIGISNWVRTSDNMIPSRAKISGAYANSSIAKADAHLLGYDDALMLTLDGHVAEGSAANFFMIKDNVLYTASKYADILEGITRRSIIQIALDMGVRVYEREIDRTEVYTADEAFLCGTGVQVAWISEVDNRIIGNGKIGSLTAKIQKTFFNIVRGNEKKYNHWLTKI